MRIRIVWAIALLTGVASTLTGRADYIFASPDEVDANDFQPAYLGREGSLPSVNNRFYVTSNQTLRLEGRFTQQASRALAFSDDGSGNSIGYYKTNTLVSMRYQYVADGSLPANSSTVQVGMGIRQRASTGVNTYPLYKAMVMTNTLLLIKRAEFNDTFRTNLAVSALPTELGGTNLYTLRLSATELGTNSFGEIVLVELALLENDAIVSELDYTDTPTSSVANTLGASRAEGHVSLLGGSVLNSDQFVGIDVLNYVVHSAPDAETLRLRPIHTAMAVGMTNRVLISRGGDLSDLITIDWSSSEPTVIDATGATELEADQIGSAFSITGQSAGSSVITASGTGYPDATATVTVYDVAYDASSYAQLATAFTNGGNSGLGFLPWVLTNNNGAGVGYTNQAGAVLANSRNGDVSVNEEEFRSFALFAYGTGDGAPFAEAVRPFNASLAVGQAAAVNIGIGSRNGDKGVALRNSGVPLFEVYAGYSDVLETDAYLYRIGTNDSVALPWSNHANTRILVDAKRVDDTLYDITLVRGGGLATNESLGIIDLGPLPPDEFMFYCNDGIIGTQHYLYFDQLTLYTGYTLNGEPETDGIPDSWWDRYSIASEDRVAADDPDIDGEDNLSEYIADTDPTDDESFFPNLIESPSGAHILTLQTGPTTNSRVYDVWWTTNLTANPQTWTRYGLNVIGNGALVNLHVTNDAPSRMYRTGVALPD
jgi:hypothetical protein